MEDGLAEVTIKLVMANQALRETTSSVIFLCLLISLNSYAGIITINHNEFLPISGESDLDLDLNGIYDISLDERYRRIAGNPNREAWINLAEHSNITEGIIFLYI